MSNFVSPHRTGEEMAAMRGELWEMEREEGRFNDDARQVLENMKAAQEFANPDGLPVFMD